MTATVWLSKEPAQALVSVYTRTKGTSRVGEQTEVRSSTEKLRKAPKALEINAGRFFLVLQRWLAMM